MEIGTRFIGDQQIAEVQIEGRGGDSVHDQYYATLEDAVLAAAIDKVMHSHHENNTPRKVTAKKFSDGVLIVGGAEIRIRPRPSQAEIDAAKAKIPVHFKVLFEA